MDSIFNIDTLIIAFDILDYESVVKKYIDTLERAKESSRNNLYANRDNKEYVTVGDMEFEIMPAGARGYAYLLHNDLMELRIAMYRSITKSFYPLVVRFKSNLLWEMGLSSYSYVASFIRKSFNHIISTKVSRCDLALHIDGLAFTVKDLDSFVGRFRKDSLHRCDRQVESLYFGSRTTNKCLCRIYNKTREVLEKRDKYWFFDIWDKAGLDITNVWNIEFELHRDFLKECKIDSWDDLKNNINSLWYYLTNEWLRYVDLSTATRRENCKIQPLWHEVQKGYDYLEFNGYIERAVQRLRDTSKYVPSAVGYLTSLSALVGIDDVDDAIHYLKFAMQNYLSKNKDSDFADEVSKKKMYYTKIAVE